MVSVFHKSDRHRQSDLQFHVTYWAWAWALEDLKSGRARVQLGLVEEMWPPSLSPPLFSYSLLLIHLTFSYFCGTKYIHKLVLTKSQVTSSTFANFGRYFSHMEVTLAQMVWGTLLKIPASGQNVPQCALLVCFTWHKFLQNILKQKTWMF